MRAGLGPRGVQRERVKSLEGGLKRMKSGWLLGSRGGAAVAVLLGGCAFSGPPVYGPGDVDQPAEVVGCPSTETTAGPRVVVPVAIVVDGEGRVVSARHTRNWTPPSAADDGFERRVAPDVVSDYAEQLARACSYRPALLNGIGVRSRLVHEFTFAYQPSYADLAPGMGGGGGGR